MQLMRVVGIVAVCSVLAEGLAAQSTMILGVKVGSIYSTMSTTSAGAKPDYRSAGMGGAIVGMTIGEQFAIEGQGLYVAKGFGSDTTTGVDVAMTLHYVEMPVALTWTPLGRTGLVTPRIFAGGSVGFRAGCSFTATSPSPLVNCDPQSVRDFDLGFVGGVGLKIGKGTGGLLIEVTYSQGFIDAVKTPSVAFKNRAITASIGYVFAII